MTITRRGFLKGVGTAVVVQALPAPTPITKLDVFIDNTNMGKPEPVFTLPDGTKIALSDWVDDKHYETLVIPGRGCPISAFVAARSGSIEARSRCPDPPRTRRAKSSSSVAARRSSAGRRR